MTVSFSLHQVTSIVDGPLYQVKNEITAAESAPTAIFVYKTVTQAFDHYATAADLESWPDTYEAANADSLAFYRQASVTRGWTTAKDMNADVDLTKMRVQFLANDLTQLQAASATDTTTVIQGT